MVMPIFFRLSCTGTATRSIDGLYSSSSNSMGWPVLTLVIFPPRTCQPASLSSALALRTWSRMLPEPSVIGGLYSWVNTSAGILSRMGSRIFSSSGPRQALGLVLRVLEVGAGARVLAVEEVLVHPLEVHGVVEGHAHPAVLEDGPLGVEHQGLHPLRDLVGDLFLLDVAVAEVGPRVHGGPVLGDVLHVQVVLAGLEGLEGHGLVAVVVVAQPVEVVLPLVHRQVQPPVVLHAARRPRTGRSCSPSPCRPRSPRGSPWRARRTCAIPSSASAAP